MMNASLVKSNLAIGSEDKSAEKVFHRVDKIRFGFFEVTWTLKKPKSYDQVTFKHPNLIFYSGPPTVVSVPV